jgi:hypothetical protein
MIRIFVLRGPERAGQKTQQNQYGGSETKAHGKSPVE